MKKDSTFRKVMEIRDELKDTEGYDWLENDRSWYRYKGENLAQSIVCHTTCS